MGGALEVKRECMSSFFFSGTGDGRGGDKLLARREGALIELFPSVASASIEPNDLTASVRCIPNVDGAAGDDDRGASMVPKLMGPEMRLA